MNIKYRIIQYAAVIIPCIAFAYLYDPQKAQLDGLETPIEHNVAATAPEAPTEGAGTALDEIGDQIPSDEPLAGGELDAVVPDAEADAGLAYIESLRQIPDAAPLVDEIVEYLKNDEGSDFTLDQLDFDENGLAVIDGDTNKKMIKNPDILKKWEKLMQLIAANEAAKRLEVEADKKL